MGQSKYQLTIQAGLCLVGCLQLVAFTSLLFQLPHLYGRHGVQPISTVLEAAQRSKPGTAAWAYPSLLWLHGSLGLTAEAALAALCCLGWLLSAAAAAGAAHPLVFAGAWVTYFSFRSLGGPFVEYGDEVLLEVSFAAIWLAIAHQANKRAAAQQSQGAGKQQSDMHALSGEQQQPQPAQQLSAATLLLVKWLLFRLLLVGSTFSATYLCGQDPALGSCWKTLAAHGLPHTFTRWLQALPGPVAAAAAAVTLLELPVAFLVLAFAPVLQHAAATGLLGLQLLRLLFGPASLANIAAAVLCFLLLDDGLWVPALLKASRVLRLPAAKESSTGEEVQEDGHAGGTESLSRQSSITSLAGEMFKLPDELGASALDTYGWTPIVAAVALAPCAALLLSYDTQLGLLMRPAAAQLLKVLQVVVPLAMLVWAAATARVCWRCVSAAVAAGRGSAAQALADAAQAASAAEAAEREAAQAIRQAEQAAQQAGQAATAVDAAGTPQHEANGAVANGVHQLAGEDAAADGHDTDGEADAAAPGKAAAHKRGRPAKSAAGSKAATAKAAKAAKEAAAESPRAASGSKARTPKQQSAATEDAEEAPAATPKRGSAGRSGGKAASTATAAAAAAERAEAARQEAAACKQAAAAAAAARKQHLRQARVGAWVPAVAAAAVAAAVLAVFVSGAPPLLTAVSFSPSAVSRVFPGPVGQLALLGQSLGLASTSLSARAGFAATQAAAAAAGPGAVALCESYVLDADAAPGEGRAVGSWQRVPLHYSLGSAQFKSKGGLWQKVKGLRGLCQMRLQAAMVTAAAALGRGAGAAGGSGSSSEAEHWLMVLAHKIVQGALELDGLISHPVQQHEFVTVSRAVYQPGSRDWRLAAAHTSPAVESQHRDSSALKVEAVTATAAPGQDGPLVSLLEGVVRSLSGPGVLAALLLAVLARHLLLPGGLLQDCQRAMPPAAEQ